MKLQTQIPLSKANNPIDYDSNVLLLGSCFVENIGEKLAYFKFRAVQNPFGILFHPLAIENLVERALLQKEYTTDDVFFLNGRWHCFEAHSRLSHAVKEDLLLNLNKGLIFTREQLQKASHIILTLGTGWGYRFKKTGAWVANCHKVPQGEFSKELSSAKDIQTSLRQTVEKIRSVNRDARIIFTISPVRHLKDGFVENQRSKSHLITAVHKLIGVPPLGARGLYFPSYELMMDELRDYRFYKEDMVHPNALAVDYIWERFKEVWISEEAHAVMQRVDAIQKGLAHKPFDSDSNQHKEFKKSIRQKITYLQEKYPFMVFNEETV